MIARPGPLALLVVLAVARAAPAQPAPRAGVIEDGALGYALRVPDGWRLLEVSGPDVVVAYAGPTDDHTLAVTRREVGTRVLGSGDALAAALERGVAGATAGYVRTARRRTLRGRTEIVDLDYRSDGAAPAQVALRFLVQPGRTIAVTIRTRPDAPRASRRAAAAVRDSLRPFP